MLKFAIPAVAALGLIACAAHSQATNADVQIVAAPMGWHLSREDAVAKLAYGVEHSDQLALMLTCRPGEARAVVYGDARPAAAHQTKPPTAGLSIDPLSGDLADQASIPVRDPSLRAWARSGKLAVKADAGDFELSATEPERRLIRDFLAYCASDRM